MAISSFRNSTAAVSPRKESFNKRDTTHFGSDESLLSNSGTPYLTKIVETGNHTLIRLRRVVLSQSKNDAHD